MKMLRDEALCSEGKSLLPLALDEPGANYQGKGAVFYQVVQIIRSLLSGALVMRIMIMR